MQQVEWCKFLILPSTADACCLISCTVLDYAVCQGMYYCDMPYMKDPLQYSVQFNVLLRAVGHSPR